VWADERNWVSRGLIRTPPAPYQTLDERYPEYASGHPNGEVPVPTTPTPAPQPVSPGLHVPPAPAPVALWVTTPGSANPN